MNFICYFMIILTISPSQNLKTSMDKKSGGAMMVGIAQRSDLTVEHYGEWFEEEYSEYNGNKELGRIIELPIESLEEDIFNILIGAGPDPNYYDWELEQED